MPLLREGTDALAVSLRPCLSIGGHGHDFVARFPPLCARFFASFPLLRGLGRVRTFLRQRSSQLINHTTQLAVTQQGGRTKLAKRFPN